MFGSFKYDCFYDEDTCILEWWNRGMVLMERLVVEKKKIDFACGNNGKRLYERVWCLWCLFLYYIEFFL